jgi:hypothetical protein
MAWDDSRDGATCLLHGANNPGATAALGARYRSGAYNQQFAHLRRCAGLDVPDKLLALADEVVE